MHEILWSQIPEPIPPTKSFRNLNLHKHENAYLKLLHLMLQLMPTQMCLLLEKQHDVPIYLVATLPIQNLKSAVLFLQNQLFSVQKQKHI
jgi:hypothetical protein